MADDRKPGEPDPDDADSTPYQLGGGQPSGGAGQNPGGAGQNPDPSQPTNPFEAFMSQFGGGDMDQLMAQLQNAFSMLGVGVDLSPGLHVPTLTYDTAPLPVAAAVLARALVLAAE
ncbi:MAG: hypothetical protein L0H41_10610, partial [Microlunatus sp.]|nr:hypothetical protein [Microlunatus sp.]